MMKSMAVYAVLAIVWLYGGGIDAAVGADSEPVYRFAVVCEEEITSYEPAENGTNPFWCRGSPTLIREGESVFASLPETGEDIRPFCNTRWTLWQRTEGKGWACRQKGTEYNEREPFPMIRMGDGRMRMSVSPASEPEGENKRGQKTWRCQPRILEFSASEPQAKPNSILPEWGGSRRFTEHSYRSMAADPARRETLVVNVEGDVFVWCLADGGGKTISQGEIRFPKRACYQQWTLRNRAAYVLAVGDIQEPNRQWRAYKKEVTGEDWDYDFRDLYFSWTPAIGEKPFSPPLTVATRDETAGHIRNCDLRVDETGMAHVLYRVQNIWHGFMRDRYWPGKPLDIALEYCQIEKGQVVLRQNLLHSQEKAPFQTQSFSWDGPSPIHAMFHVTPDGAVLAFYSVNVKKEDGSEAVENYVRRVHPEMEPAAKKLSMKHPLSMFFTASPRMGNEPSWTMDLLGETPEKPNTLCYAQIRIDKR